ncbi:SbtR family transcriptional regulator [Kitasatospora griseola]|uniref:SbtR family transcriptional regulator n=1 Tax=Kitasatospora griseola TaxID=2064 RepID=UPI001671753C|nr:hypothetical protein [Kitasatospora griseola]
MPRWRSGSPAVRPGGAAWRDSTPLRFTDRAGQAGALRGDTTGADLFTLMNAAAWSREHDTREQADRLLELALAGMLATTPPPACE